MLCRKDHLALSSAGALALARIWVGPRPDGDAAGAAEERAWPDPNKPILTLVLPAGAANDPPLLDVHLRGATLSRRSYKVRVVVDKRELPLLTEEKPRKLSLAPGRHRITVDLLDKRGTRVGNAVNRTDRSFNVGN